MDTIKKDMTDYWSRRVEKFSCLRQREFVSEKHGLWLTELRQLLPRQKNLNILDIGTGTGFFAFLLAEQGHHVTGIDLTPDMIAEAQRIAQEHGFSVDFRIMDAESPSLSSHSFDVIVTRKLTWTLPDLAKAYQKWHALLKPQGILINFDADYCREKPPVLLPKHHAHQDVSTELMSEYERMKGILRLTQNPRPMWDAELLESAGFSNIKIDTGAWKRIYHTMDELYDPTPGFVITATA